MTAMAVAHEAPQPPPGDLPRSSRCWSRPSSTDARATSADRGRIRAVAARAATDFDAAKLPESARAVRAWMASKGFGPIATSRP
jgi:hypothetical protein